VKDKSEMILLMTTDGEAYVRYLGIFLRKFVL